MWLAILSIFVSAFAAFLAWFCHASISITTQMLAVLSLELLHVHVVHSRPKGSGSSGTRRHYVKNISTLAFQFPRVSPREQPLETNKNGNLATHVRFLETQNDELWKPIEIVHP